MFEEPSMEEPLLSDEETNALLDAMREEETRGEVEAKKTDLGSPEGPMRDALGRADAAAIQLGRAARTQLLKQTARGMDVELLPAEIVPRDVLASSIDPNALMFTLRSRGEQLGVVALDSNLGRAVLERCMGAPETNGEGAAPTGKLSELDRRILKPFPAAVVAALGETFLRGRPLELDAHDDADDGGVRFEPMLRLGLRFSSGGQRAGELLLALTAAAVTSACPKQQAAREALQKKKAAAPRARDLIVEKLSAAEVDIVAVLGRAPSSVRDLLALRTGDVLRLHGAPGDPVALCIDDVLLGHGNPVVHKGDLAIEVTSREQKGRQES
ncbi:MAG: hypothetical protein SangKO_018920 [Sandaracinaceae bacterium]